MVSWTVRASVPNCWVTITARERPLSPMVYNTGLKPITTTKMEGERSGVSWHASIYNGERNAYNIMCYVASFPGPTQLSITFSMASHEKLGDA